MVEVSTDVAQTETVPPLRHDSMPWGLCEEVTAACFRNNLQEIYKYTIQLLYPQLPCGTEAQVDPGPRLTLLANVHCTCQDIVTVSRAIHDMSESNTSQKLTAVQALSGSQRQRTCRSFISEHAWRSEPVPACSYYSNCEKSL